MIPAALPWAALAIVVVGGVVVAVVMWERRRREALEQYCLVRGYRFERERPGAEADLEAFGMFRQGHHRRWRATIAGQIGGRPFTAFEYSYVTGGGKNSNHHRLSVMLWQSAEASLPAFTVVTEGFFRRLAQRFGAKDFDFADDPGFSRAYQLQGDDEAAVRALFTPTRRAFLAAPAPDGVKATRYQVAGAGSRLVWWSDGRLPGPDALDEFLAEGDRLRRQFLQ